MIINYISGKTNTNSPKKQTCHASQDHTKCEHWIAVTKSRKKNIRLNFVLFVFLRFKLIVSTQIPN